MTTLKSLDLLASIYKPFNVQKLMLGKSNLYIYFSTKGKPSIKYFSFLFWLLWKERTTVYPSAQALSSNVRTSKKGTQIPSQKKRKRKSKRWPENWNHSAVQSGVIQKGNA